MVVYGVDVHPAYQAGIDIERIAAEGFGFLAAKVSEATMTFDSIDWLRRARAAGMIALGYHFLQPGNESAQAAVFAAQLSSAGVPGMLDAEALGADGTTATLTMASIQSFLSECQRRGARVPFVYLPRWYWQRMGSPDLSGLPARLWASSYVGGPAAASDLFEAVTPRYWASYGGLPVSVLQFTDCGTVAGREIDCNAFPGTRDELAAFIGSSADITKEDDVGLIPFILTPGTSTLAFECPVGKASSIIGAAWISAMSKGPVSGTVRYWFQDDNGGISESPAKTDPPAPLTFADGHSTRYIVPVPDGTTMIRADYTLLSGGTIVVETKPK